DDRLARASGHRQQRPAITLGYTLDSAIDCDFLVVARRLAAQMVSRRQQSFGRLGLEGFGRCQASPEFGGRRKSIDLALQPSSKGEFNDPVTVGCVRKLEPEDLSIILGLLNAVARSRVAWL